MSIMAEIVRDRRARIAREGVSLGHPLPEHREVPLVPFGRAPFVICEIKRRSPSRGTIASGLDAPEQASLYAGLGARSVSVLTEEDHFSGSLADLIAVKRTNPELCVLRKDFLLSTEDIEVSYLAGADAVLLIAGILDKETLTAMYARATALGMSCLVEVHTPEEVEKVASVRPEFTGINARDLRNFSVDLTLPLALKPRIGWTTKLVFESGIHSMEHAAFAAGNGFAGILVGEAVVRNPDLIRELIQGLEESRGAFWSRLYTGKATDRPLVKICGLTNATDAKAADDLGADLLGFIFAPSKRRVEPGAVRRIGATRAQKIGVVVVDDASPALDPDVLRLLEEGILDAVQFHGNE
ncbi:MAG TPA: bifunctional indole-3-glycerol phosphate synthase/phosphoribosylanthranilate isomerase, partial [Spirochaetia bacterium]|nr:bifunctional indole-3-glycerol phosphate synthase/phosphoribosylanthranilate isomerase [Spirochaetia bacterium]